MTEAKRKAVPSVVNALAILEVLRAGANEPRTLSDIARATSMNVSTCFNILKTLEDAQAIAFEPGPKTYRLGRYLAELGALVDERAQAQRLVMDEVRRVADAVGLGCFLMTMSERGEFVVVDKVDSRNPIRVTIEVGTSFPVTGAVAAKAWFAWASPAALQELVGQSGLPQYTPRSITDLETFEDELAGVRRRGYSVSLSEYYPDHNAVAAVVYDWALQPQFLLVVVGTTSQLSDAALTEAGDAIAAAADRATTRIGGRHPGWDARAPEGDEPG